MKLVFFSSKSPEKLIEFINRLGTEFRHLGAPQFDGKAWVMWGQVSKDSLKIIKQIGDID